MAAVKSPARPAARKSADARKTPVFVFSAAGKLLSQHESVQACADKLAMSRSTVNAALQRGGILASQFYVSTESVFKLKNFNQQRNPLAPRSQHPNGRASQAGHLAHEFNEFAY